MDDPSLLRVLLDHAQDKLVVIDEDGTYRYANDAVERILGYSPEEIVGENAFELMHPADRDPVREAFEGLVEHDEGTTETVEYRYRTADDEWVWLESRMSNRLVSDLDGYVVSSRDVTDRKRAEERERETETRLERIAANAEDVLWMFTGDWSELLFGNEAYEDIYGGSLETVREDPTSFLDTIHPEDRERVLEYMVRNAAGEATDIEYRVNPERDYRRWVWVKAQPVVRDGDVTRIVGFSRDITDRRRRERQLRVMDNLLRHNLRNDMNVILGHAELVREHADDPVADSMDVILETGRELLETAAKERAIIDVLVGLGDRERLDLVDLVADTVEAFRRANPAASVSVVAPEDLEVVALPEVRRALEELLENSVEHAEADPEIDIDVRPFDDHVELEVRDNAPPIPGNEFEPLFGEDEPDELYHGTGLGLWLVYWVVDLSDGDISFHCSQDGNLVSVTLPRAEREGDGGTDT